MVAIMTLASVATGLPPVPAPRRPVGPAAVDVVVAADGRRWRRTLLRTPWLTAADDLGGVLASVLAGRVGEGDVVAVAEKIAVVTSGRVVNARDLRVGRLARLLARAVRPVGESRGLSLPTKMQFVLDRVGSARVVAAALATALTRPLGWRGVFYRIAGDLARDLDGLRGAYAEQLLPPLLPAEAALLAHHLANRLGCAVAIVDINDRGGSIRAVSAAGPEPDVLLAALADNPHGDCDAATPVVALRALPTPRLSGVATRRATS